MWGIGGAAPASAFDAEVQADLANAERAGFRLAVIGRNAALVAVALFYVYVMLWTKDASPIGLALALIVVGLIQLRLIGTRHERLWQRYAFFALDVAAVGAYLAFAPISPGADVPQNLVFLGSGPDFFFVIIAASFLTLSPALVVWTGLCTVVTLWAVTGWILLGMEHFVSYADLGPFPTRETYLGVVLNPDFMGVGNRIDECLKLLLVTFIAALAVHRARGVVRARAAAEQKRSRVQRLFGQYVPSQVAEAIMASDKVLAPQTREASVLFADIEGFTRLSEHLPPVGVISLLNRFFEAATEIVGEHGGVVVNFVGDGMIAAFNAPLPAEDHAARSVTAADALLALVCAREFDGRRLGLRIGIATGPVAAGSVGGSGRQTYTLYGDTVNLAQRLQALNKDMGTVCLVCDATYRAAGPACADAVPSGTVAVRGRDRPVETFALAERARTG